MKPRLAALLLLAAAARGLAGPPITVPVYIEDSHAGSFYWLADHLDLDEEVTLVHFDAHSDASAIFDSDQIRERLRRVSSLEERHQLLEQWRAAGVIQCYNWIEPLLPAPISRVLWVSRGHGADEKKARAQLDGHLEAAPRGAGSFRDRYQAVAFDRLRTQLKAEPPVVITIDLDYFADVPKTRRAAEFERVWKFVAECRNLRAVTLAISRPYLKSDEQTDELVRLALEASLSLPTAAIQLEPFAQVGDDRSLRAREFRKRKEAVPAFRLAAASEKLRAVLLANRERITARTQPELWNQQLAAWEKEAAEVELAVRDREPSIDRIWRVPVTEDAEIELQTNGAIARVEWFALVPQYARCNLTAESSDHSAFAVGAPPRPRWRQVRLAGSERTISISRSPGAVRVKARVEIDGHTRETRAIEVRRYAGAGFQAALTEQFGLPYLFGSGELRANNETGPETGFGADCANFVVYALRRQGYAAPWSNPKQLKKYLEPMAQGVRPREARIDAESIATGLIVHLGNHVAAVMEDRLPLDLLDEADQVAHQLEGVPEIVSLGQLLASRKAERFDLWRVPATRAQFDLLVGGDVMLGRTIGAEIERGADPLAGLGPMLERASARIVNLECVLSDKGAAAADKRYCFRAPLEAIRVLTGARIDGVSLANNHAADFGPEGLLDAMAHLQANHISVIGGNEPSFFKTRTGANIGVVALDDTNRENVLDRDRAAAAIADARRQAFFVLVFMHWGEENTGQISERQRDLARWLIELGVDAIAGAHPHCLQPFDSYRARPIFYSLGNLVFDGAPNLPSWNRGALLEVDLGTARPVFRVVPVQLDARGFPQMAESDYGRGDAPLPAGKIRATAGAALSRNRVQRDSNKR